MADEWLPSGGPKEPLVSDRGADGRKCSALKPLARLQVTLHNPSIASRPALNTN